MNTDISRVILLYTFTSISSRKGEHKMKLVFDGKGLIKDHMFAKVIPVPTTANEKRFFSFCKDVNGNYKPWVYEKLYELGNSVIDNPMADIYDEDGSLIYDSYPLMEMVREAEQESDFAALPKPSNFCILGLCYALSKRFRKARQVKLLHRRMIDLWINQSCINYY